MELTVLPDPLTGFEAAALWQREKEKKERKERKKEGKRKEEAK